MTKLTDLLKAPAVEAADQLYIVDTSDTTDDPAGSSRRVPLSDLSNTVLVKVKQEVITDPGVSGFVFTVPSGATRAWIEGSISSAATGVSETVKLFFNGGSSDTGYHRQNLLASDGGTNVVEGANAVILNVPSAGAAEPGSQYASIMVDRLAAGAAAYGFGHYMYKREAASIQGGTTYTFSSVTDEITSISLVSGSGASLSGTMTLYLERELDLLALT